MRGDMRARVHARVVEAAIAAPPAPTRYDHQPGDEREPRVEVLGQHVLRQRERHEPEREHADRVRDRDRRAEHERVRAAVPRVPIRYAATIALP